MKWLKFILVVPFFIFSVSHAQKRLALSESALQHGLFGTLLISPLDSSGKLTSRICSSTYIGEGLLLTNWHCLGCIEPKGCQDKGLKFAEKYHPEGWVQVATTKSEKEYPVPAYKARYSAGDPSKDVAVMKIFEVWGNPTAPVPSILPIPAITLGDPSKAKIKDPIYVIGYPTIGFGTVTFNEGTIGGYLDLIDNDQKVDTFKVSAAINGGNSGGLLMNDIGEQIGIPQFSPKPEFGTGVNGAIMIHVALPYIEEARKGGTGGYALPSLPADLPSIAPLFKPSFGKITFGLTDSDAANNPRTLFPAGTKEVYGVYSCFNLQKGTKWGWIWYRNGAVYSDKRDSQTWQAGLFESSYVFIRPESGLQSGKYELELYLTGAPVQRAAFTVEERTTPPPVPPTKTLGTVVIKGQVVDAYTGTYVSNASIQVFRSGETSSIAKLLYGTSAVTDLFGDFTTFPGIAKGFTYDIEITAPGYRTKYLKDTFRSTIPILFNTSPLKWSKWLQHSRLRSADVSSALWTAGFQPALSPQTSRLSFTNPVASKDGSFYTTGAQRS